MTSRPVGTAATSRVTNSGSQGHEKEKKRGRNASLNASRNCVNDYTTVSRSSSYNHLQFTNELENIYREFENGDVTEMNQLRRLVSHFRSNARRLQVQLTDLKSKTNKEIAKLKDKYKEERKRRIKVQEEKLERQAQLMQDISDKDSIIFNLNK